jgi:hypothetical protein
MPYSVPRATSTLSLKGGWFLGGKAQPAVFAVFGEALLLFAGRLFVETTTSL